VSQRRPSTFDNLPAIDLRDGRVVRLRQGDFSREEVFSDDPAAMARAFVEDGAPWIHVVDLDGARTGRPRQLEAIVSLAQAVRQASGQGTRLQVAGGLRTSADLAAAFDAGADRVVVGTAALADPEFVGRAVARHGASRIVVAIDIRGSQAVGDGWVDGGASGAAAALVAAVTAAGVERIAVTAIERDGLLEGPDLGLLEAMVASTDASVIASGGIRSIADLLGVRDIGCRGAIVGRALYDGTLALDDALGALAPRPTPT
jgi:phosphoribosylformimino-5-aminoimidazole carboxamide ribotide isomerase